MSEILRDVVTLTLSTSRERRQNDLDGLPKGLVFNGDNCAI